MKKRRTPEQIVGKLRQAEVELGKGQTVPQVCKQIGINEQTCYFRAPPKNRRCQPPDTCLSQFIYPCGYLCLMGSGLGGSSAC
jgi:hypothetical protein